MDSLQEIEQKQIILQNQRFINLGFLITLLQAHERRWFLTVFQCTSEWWIGMGCAIMCTT